MPAPPIVIGGYAAFESLLAWLGIGTVAVGTAVVIAENMNEANKAAGSSQSGITSYADACSSCMPPQCQEKANEIINTRNELERRNLDLYVDKHNLFNDYYDISHPSYGSWKGHIEQFENRQRRLRRLLAEYRAMGCPEYGKPDDSDYWGSRQPVDRPENMKR